MKTVLVVACVLLAQAAAFKVSPNLAWDIGGTGSDHVLAVVADATGAVYVAGWTDSAVVNSTVSTGGPTVTFKSTQTYASAAGGSNGFVTKYSVSGARVWTAMVTGVNAESVNALALSGDESLVLLCGTYSSTDAAIVGGDGASTAFVDLAGTTDAFAAALNSATGVFTWKVRGFSDTDDECLTIAEHGGSVVFGGSCIRDPTHTSGGIALFSLSSISVSATVQSLEQSDFPDYPTGYIARVDTATGLQGFLTYSIREFNGGRFNPPGVTRALAFDENGNLFVASTRMSFVLAPTGSYPYSFQWGPDETNDLNIIVVNAAGVQTGATFEMGTRLAVAALRRPPQTGSTTYPSPNPHSIDYVAIVGSDGDDVVTGISVSNVNNTLATARVVLTGYTTGATAGSTFHWYRTVETTNETLFRALAPATVRDFTFASTAETGWYVALPGLFQDTPATDGLFAKPLPSGFTSSRLTSVKCTGPAPNHCFASGTVSGTGTFTVGGAARAVTTAGKDAVVFRFDANGNVLWLEQSGGPLDDTGDVIAYYAGSGPVRPGAYALVAGTFQNVSVQCAASNSPVSVYSRGGVDAFVVSYDDVDDCGLDPTPGSSLPYGANACRLNADLNSVGSSLCLDEPGFPLCFCHMNVTDGGVGQFCNTRGWNCKFMAQYYFGLLDMCECPAAPNPHPENPLLDVEVRLTLCAGQVCGFGALTGAHANCMPLVADLMAVCGASADTPAQDKVYIGAFQSVYDACPRAASSSTAGGGDPACEGYDFCAAPRASSPAMTALATLGALLLSFGLHF